MVETVYVHKNVNNLLRSRAFAGSRQYLCDKFYWNSRFMTADAIFVTTINLSQKSFVTAITFFMSQFSI